MNTLNIEMMKQGIEDRTRKLSARWTVEVSQDISSYPPIGIPDLHFGMGIDLTEEDYDPLDHEIVKVLSEQITMEIDKEILNELSNHSSAGGGSESIVC